MQLERILQREGFGSRKECRALIRAGRVSLAGAPCHDPFADCAENLAFTIDEADWQARAQVYLMLHKPAAYECSRKPGAYPGVLDLLPAPLRRRGVQPVGRLDADTTGLLLLSDDGAFIHRLTSPRHGVDKVYEVTVKHAIEAALIDALDEGVLLRDESTPTAAAGCVALDSHRLRLTLREGKYHQVKRMIAAAGNRVVALKRVAVGGLALPDDLVCGDWRWLDAAELASLERPR
jgi:16S rRNA pseudouridine516 synthase